MNTLPRRIAILAAGALLVGIAGAGIGVAAAGSAGANLVSSGSGGSESGALAASGANAGALDDAALADLALAAVAPQDAPAANAAPGPNGAGPGILRRLGRGRAFVHAVVTLQRPAGLVTFQVDQGTLATIASGSLTIGEAGGRSETVATSAQTRVRKDAQKSALTNLAAGDHVIVVSRFDASGKPVALLVIVPRPAGSGPAASPAASPGSNG